MDAILLIPIGCLPDSELSLLVLEQGCVMSEGEGPRERTRVFLGPSRTVAPFIHYYFSSYLGLKCGFISSAASRPRYAAKRGMIIISEIC